MDADIAAYPEAYPHITTPDPNIDFRRVNTLDTFFRRHAQVLTCDLSDGQQWQPGDIVVFGDRVHIGLCSDRRNRQGIPFLIHHGNPIDAAKYQFLILAAIAALTLLADSLIMVMAYRKCFTADDQYNPIAG